MAGEVSNALKNAAVAFSKYVEDIATMTVETRAIDLSTGNAGALQQAQPVAQTIIRLDGDSQTIIPARKTESGRLEVDAELLEIHQRNVTTAIEYRARILSALASALMSK